MKHQMMAIMNLKLITSKSIRLKLLKDLRRQQKNQLSLNRNFMNKKRSFFPHFPSNLLHPNVLKFQLINTSLVFLWFESTLIKKECATPLQWIKLMFKAISINFTSCKFSKPSKIVNIMYLLDGEELG